MKKFDRALSVIYAVCGSVATVCFGAYLIKQFFYPEGRFPLFVAAAALLAVALPVLFRRPLRRLLGKAYPVLKAVMCAGLLFFTVSFAVLCAVIGVRAGEARVPAPDYGEGTVFIVFGAKTERDGRPSVVLAARLDRAAEAMENTPGSVCIVSGGQGSNEIRPEADSMRDYLISRGIAADRIITEPDSHNTAENIRNSVKLIGNMDGVRRVVCVSTFTHVGRIRILAGREGLEAEYLASPFPKKELIFPNLVREYLSYARTYLIGY